MKDFYFLFRMVDAVFPNYPRRRMVALQVPDKDDVGRFAPNFQAFHACRSLPSRRCLWTLPQEHQQTEVWRDGQA